MSLRKYSEGVPANLQPASSRELFVCELPTQPDALSTTYPKRITVYTRTTTTTDPTTGISKTEYSNQLEWTAQAGQNYTIYRAEANPLPGTFQEIGAVTADTYIDRTPLNTKVYAYRVSPTQSVVKNRVYSNVAFDQPRRPAGLMASVEGANLVKLRWDEAIEPDVAGYNVYRAWGSDVRVEGAGKKINTTLINESRLHRCDRRLVRFGGSLLLGNRRQSGWQGEWSKPLCDDFSGCPAGRQH